MANSPAPAAARPPLDQFIDRLAAFEPSSSPVLSLYLDLRADQHGRDSFEPFIRKVFAERQHAFPADSPERRSFDEDVVRIQAYLRDRVERPANGLALFACAGADGFFEAVQFDSPIERHWLFIGTVPHLYPLVRLVDQYPRYAAVVLDTRRAQIFVFGLNATEREADLTSAKTRRTSVGGWSQARYQRHVDQIRQQHIKEIVETLDRVVTEEGLSQIVVVGHEIAVPMLKAELPPRLADMVVDVIRLERHAGERQVLQATLEALRARDADTDAARVAELLNRWRAGGLGVAGPEATLEALERGQVDELVVTASPETLAAAEAPLDPDAAILSVETSAPEAKPPERSLVLAETLVGKARRTGARIRLIEDASLLAEAGGVGGLLRFRL
jgi:peptide chain release factor subunit 1